MYRARSRRDRRGGLTVNQGSHDAPQPRFSIVSAAYNVKRYLDDFLHSLEAQTLPLDQIELIAVNDGSTDGTGDFLRDYATDAPFKVTVVDKENGGQASARNLGLEQARGEWITFTDPDDFLDPDYFANAARFTTSHPETDLMLANNILYLEALDQFKDSHPRRSAFIMGDIEVDISREPEFFPASAPTSFFKKSTIQKLHLRFDERVRPNFEDGHFSARYVLEGGSTVIGYLESAKYFYRKRADSSSTLQNSLADTGRYLMVPKYGYLDVLSKAKNRLGCVPEWLQNFVLYDLSWYFSSEDSVSAETAASGPVADEFYSLLEEISNYLDDSVIATFPLRKKYKQPWRDALIHGVKHKGANWHADHALIMLRDKPNRLIKVSYLFTGKQPDEIITSDDGSPLVAAKTRPYRYFGRDLVEKRILWLEKSESLSLELDGQNIPIKSRSPRVGDKPKWFEQNRAKPAAARPPVGEASKNKLRARLGATRFFDKRFANAWLLSDRLHDSTDSGEVTFRYLREQRPEINAYFVIEKGTPDHERLKNLGYGERLLDPGSITWHAAMKRAKFFISSHIHNDHPLVDGHYTPNFRNIFLQHGVIKDDISRYLNSKPINLMVASTPGEYASIVDDGTQYDYTNKDVMLTGLPRFDELLAARNRVSADQHDLVLLAPTWRKWLNKPITPGSHRREIVDNFTDTEFAKAWQEILTSEEIALAASEQGYKVGFLPHPNLAEALDQFEVPEHIELLSFTEGNVQEIFARGRVLVTDYSSMAFNAAYLDTPVVYYQFDAERMDAGGHTSRPGYFSYEADGFGPVTNRADDTVTAICKIIANQGQADQKYQDRINLTFPIRDGKCTERVVAGIEAIDQRNR